MNHLLRVSRVIDTINAGFGLIASGMVLAAAVVSAANASSRYLFSYSSNSWLEIQWYFFGGMVFLGAAYTLKTNGHVRVDVVYSHVSHRKQLLIDVFGLVVFLLPGMIFLGWLSWPVFTMAFVSGETSSNYGGLIRWPILLVLPLGFALLTFQGISELIKRIAALRGVADLDTHYEQPVQ